MSVEDDQAVRFVRLAHARALVRGAQDAMPVAPLDVAHEALRIWLESGGAGGTAASTVSWRVTDALRVLCGDSRKNGRALERVVDVRSFDLDCLSFAPPVNIVELKTDGTTPADWVEAFETVRDHGALPDPVPSLSTGTVIERVMRWVDARGDSGASHAVIAAECGLARETVSRALRALLADGRIAGAPGRYSLAGSVLPRRKILKIGRPPSMRRLWPNWPPPGRKAPSSARQSRQAIVGVSSARLPRSTP